MFISSSTTRTRSGRAERDAVCIDGILANGFQPPLSKVVKQSRTIYRRNAILIPSHTTAAARDFEDLCYTKLKKRQTHTKVARTSIRSFAVACCLACAQSMQ